MGNSIFPLFKGDYNLLKGDYNLSVSCKGLAKDLLEAVVGAVLGEARHVELGGWRAELRKKFEELGFPTLNSKPSILKPND